MGGSLHILKKNAEVLVVASKETGLEVNADKTKYMFMARDQDVGRSHSIKNLNIKLYRTTILPVVVYGCATQALTLREERGLVVFRNKLLRRIFGPKRDEVAGEWMICS